ncbi:hypothetical protein SLEP1_g56851 [Rubroshorea leprosula]|uniref:HIT domain-containing protein n=1 Tax=Rubroshorea leprosula TaxID=152421 RepID=A0AAV5MMA0_9ROSI|nr:hypothetical protein SLEP1_g56851 [Rubroshorea leprosula]
MLRLRPRRLVLARCRRHLSRLSLPSSLLCFSAPRSGSELRLLAGGRMPFADCGFIGILLSDLDDKVVAFQDIKPAAFRHYLVIPVEHIPTVKDLRRRSEDYSLVLDMFNVGQALLSKDAYILLFFSST